MRKKEERKRDAGREERRPFCMRVERLGQRLRRGVGKPGRGARSGEGQRCKGKGVGLRSHREVAGEARV